MVHWYKDRRIRRAAAILLLWATIGMTAPASAVVDGPRRPAAICSDGERLEALGRALVSGKEWRNLPPREQKERLREWRSLTPEQRRELRERMNRLKRMDDADRQLYERRFRQWKRLEPAERRQLLHKFDQWESLSPAEREAIRQRFRNP